MKRASKPAQKPKSFDDYLASQTPDKRAALEKLRKAIRSAVPKAEECISYGIAGFRLNGKFFVGLAATAKHCSFHLGATLQRHMDKLKKYEVSKGTIRFQPDDPLPTDLVRKLVKARIAERQEFQPARSW
ncbi:MAG TPA: DUF1801 domain-containing protein [Verrucomicrobiae bacterium]|nr:DUF1801 domain-containing protein [Verrucomicrobiae bacterium]